ncbi:MAG: hypothetical protein ABFS14_05370 [Gemmatimonadota bacterium]
MRWFCLGIALASTACTGNAYLPGQPGSLNTDLSGIPEREEWVQMHPQIDDEVKAAVLEGIFVEGMSTQAIEAVSNPRRTGVGGDAYWRSFGDDSEVRLQWYIASRRQPFIDARGRSVCELVVSADTLRQVRYCDPAAADAEQD